MKNDSRIKLIQHLYNQGTCSSRNHGIIASKGDYIMSLDPDDEYVSNSIELSYFTAKENDADVLKFQVAAKYSHSVSYNFMKCNKIFNDSKIILHEFQKLDRNLLNWYLWKKIIKRKVYIKAVNL